LLCVYVVFTLASVVGCAFVFMFVTGCVCSAMVFILILLIVLSVFVLDLIVTLWCLSVCLVVCLLVLLFKYCGLYLLGLQFACFVDLLVLFCALLFRVVVLICYIWYVWFFVVYFPDGLLSVLCVCLFAYYLSLIYCACDCLLVGTVVTLLGICCLRLFWFAVFVVVVVFVVLRVCLWSSCFNVVVV